jgi:hypothetical protein
VRKLGAEHLDRVYKQLLNPPARRARTNRQQISFVRLELNHSLASPLSDRTNRVGLDNIISKQARLAQPLGALCGDTHIFAFGTVRHSADNEAKHPRRGPRWQRHVIEYPSSNLSLHYPRSYFGSPARPVAIAASRLSRGKFSAAFLLKFNGHWNRKT